MASPPRIPRLTQHGSEVILLGLIAGGVVWLLGKVIDKGAEGFDAAAFLLVLQAIVTAIKDRWTQRSVDRLGEQLADSAPHPVKPVPKDAKEGAEQVADAAEQRAEEIGNQGRWPVEPRP